MTKSRNSLVHLYQKEGIDAVEDFLIQARSNHRLVNTSFPPTHYHQAAVWAFSNQAPDLLDCLILFKKEQLKFGSLLEKSQSSGSRAMFATICSNMESYHEDDLNRFLRKTPNKLELVLDHIPTSLKTFLFMWGIKNHCRTQWIEDNIEELVTAGVARYGHLRPLLNCAAENCRLNIYAAIVPHEPSPKVVNATLLDWVKQGNEEALYRFLKFGDVDDLMRKIDMDQEKRGVVLGALSRLEKDQIKAHTPEVVQARRSYRM